MLYSGVLRSFFVCCRMIVYPALNSVNFAFKMEETGWRGEIICPGGMFRFWGLDVHLDVSLDVHFL